MAAVEMRHPPAPVTKPIAARRRAGGIAVQFCRSEGARYLLADPSAAHRAVREYEAAVILPRVENKTRLGKKTDELAEARRRAELW